LSLVDEPEDIKAAVARLARMCHARGWAPATSGNFSARAGEQIAITASGLDKGTVEARDVLLVDRAGQPVTSGKPSAETALHVMLYGRDPQIAWIVHTHSIPAVALSRRVMARGSAAVVLRGYELTKAFAGVTTHDDVLQVPVVANSQDMVALAAVVEARLGTPRVPAFLVEGHGAYTWGGSLAEVVRHVEALETLLACVLEEERS
jgi:methylthioribulose-1-phosphate dehydratase